MLIYLICGVINFIVALIFFIRIDKGLNIAGLFGSVVFGMSAFIGWALVILFLGVKYGDKYLFRINKD